VTTLSHHLRTATRHLTTGLVFTRPVQTQTTLATPTTASGYGCVGASPPVIAASMPAPLPLKTPVRLENSKFTSFEESLGVHILRMQRVKASKSEILVRHLERCKRSLYISEVHQHPGHRGMRIYVNATSRRTQTDPSL
jgi:hypothetical protein